MALVQITIYRPLPGRHPEFLAEVVERKKIHEDLGARCRAMMQFGARPESIALVAEFADMAQLAEVTNKLESDIRWQALAEKMQADPTAEMVQQSLAGDIELPDPD